MAGLRTLLELPVYVNNPQAHELLFADLAEAIGSALNREDQIIAEYLFRFCDSDLEPGERQRNAVKRIPLSSVRQIRYPREEWVLGQLAYALFARAVAPDRAGWNHGDGYIFTDFTIDARPNDLLTARTTQYSFTILTVRDRVEFYKFGTIVKGSRSVGRPRLLSKSKTQIYVASVPVDQRSRSAGAWHIVRFNPKLQTGVEPTVIVEEDTALIAQEDRIREVGLTIAGIDPVAHQLGIVPTALLQVHVPRSIVPSYSRNVYSLVGDVMDRPLSSIPVERKDDSPMTFRPDPVVPEHRYVIEALLSLWG